MLSEIFLFSIRDEDQSTLPEIQYQAAEYEAEFENFSSFQVNK